jgi:hypothetical protein
MAKAALSPRSLFHKLTADREQIVADWREDLAELGIASDALSEDDIMEVNATEWVRWRNRPTRSTPPASAFHISVYVDDYRTGRVLCGKRPGPIIVAEYGIPLRSSKNGRDARCSTCWRMWLENLMGKAKGRGETL